MKKKLAIIFPGVGYSVDKPLLYYSRKVLAANGYEVVSVNYGDLHADLLFDAGTKQLSRSRSIAFVSKAKEYVSEQLARIDFSKIEDLVFVSKSIGSVVGAIYAKQNGLNPYHLMFTPLEYAFQFVEKENGSVFCGNADPLVSDKIIKEQCLEYAWAFHLFKGGNHSLETGNVDLDMEHLRRAISVVGEVISDLATSIYSFEVLDRKQQPVSLSKYRDKVLLIVNTATGCGFTPQYQVLEAIYEKYQKQGLEILDFPCNQFSNQAPGTSEEIFSFCSARYDITFEQFAKIRVNGEQESDLYQFLKARKGFKGFDMSKPDSAFLIHKLEKESPDYETSSDIKWNFTKFLVNRKGQVIERFEPTTDLNLVEEAIARLL